MPIVDYRIKENMILFRSYTIFAFNYDDNDNNKDDGGSGDDNNNVDDEDNSDNGDVDDYNDDDEDDDNDDDDDVDDNNNVDDDDNSDDDDKDEYNDDDEDDTNSQPLQDDLVPIQYWRCILLCNLCETEWLAFSLFHLFICACYIYKQCQFHLHILVLYIKYIFI